MTTVDDTTLSLDDLFDRLADEPLTYRQLTHWLRRYPDLFSDTAHSFGSGYPRRYTERDVDRLRVLARAAAAGLSLNTAAQLAASGPGEYQLTDHITVRVSA